MSTKSGSTADVDRVIEDLAVDSVNDHTLITELCNRRLTRSGCPNLTLLVFLFKQKEKRKEDLETEL